MEIYHEDGTAIDSNRIHTSTGSTIAVYDNGVVSLQYDADLNRWQVIHTHYGSLDYYGGGGGSDSWDVAGNDIYNINSGNVGIGTNVPNAKLEIESPSSYTVPNVTIKESNPIEFARLQMQNTLDPGYFWQIGTNNATNLYDERMLFHNSRGGNVLSLTGDANVGIGSNHIFPLASLDVLRGTGFWGTAVFRGTDISSHFNFGTSESTMIRGGKTSSRVFLNDWHNGDVLISGGGGNVNIGSNNTPVARLEVQAGTGSQSALVIRGNHFNSVFHNPNFNGSTFIRSSNSSGYIALADQGTMKVGIGMTDPNATLSVARKDGIDGTAVFFGSSHASHFNYHTAEDTYIRGGKDGSVVYINDTHNGPVVIGSTLVGGYKLSVNGSIRSKEVVVEAAGWPDYVFKDDYKLTSIDEVQAFIAKNGHLPNIPSAEEIEKNGQALGDTQKRMMEKIEELTLYIIELKKEIDFLKNKIK
jgi:hypothetical protein